jgi:ATP/maltotriose-dependent transcriptional regulator MalT
LQIFTDAKQDFYASSTLFGLGDVLMIRDDLSGARKKHDAALAFRQKEHGNVRELFDSRIRMAELSLEQGQSPDAEAGVRQALKDYAAQDEPAARIEADVVLVRSLVAQGKLPQAQAVVTSDRNLMAQSEDWISRISFNILSSQLLTASGNSKEAMDPLQACVEKSKKSGFGQLEFEARLALGEAEIKAGYSTTGRAELASLQRDARAKGFLLIARKAAAARKQKTTIHRTPGTR